MQKNIDKKSLILHIYIYIFLISIIAVSNASSILKLLFMVMSIVEIYYIIIRFHKIGLILGVSFNLIGFIVLYTLHGINSLYYSSIYAYQLATIISLIVIYQYQNKLIKIQNELIHIAYHDHLTGLYNQRYYTKYINDIHHQSVKLSLFIIDIDKFKEINDDYGHSTGDQVLKLISQYLSKILNCDEYFFRYGGDEFLIIQEHTSSDKMNDLNQRIMNTISSINLNNDLPIKRDLALSIGTSIYPNLSPDFESLFHDADQALYQAKDFQGSKIVYFSNK